MALGLAVYYPVLSLLPLGGDNLYALAWVDQATVQGLLRLDPAIYPEWRPLAYQTLWLEHSFVQLRYVFIHHFVNLAIWVTCAWLVYRLVRELGGARPWAVAAAGLLLVDRRLAEAMTWIIERQTPLACAFGLLACLLVAQARERTLSRREWLAVSALLLAAALSKEYGLAFAAALAVAGAFGRRTDLATAGLAAALAYVGLRLTLAGGAFGLYCEDMGYMFEMRPQCVDPLSATVTGQMLYNIAANGLGIVLRGVFDNDGRLSLNVTLLVPCVLLLAAAAGAFFRRTGPLYVLALVPIFNALLGAMIYRGRNQLVGVCAMAVLTGVGLSLWEQRIAFRLRLPLRAAILGALLAFGCWRAVGTHERVRSDVAELVAEDPCDSLMRTRPFVDRFARRVKATYGMDNPDCLQTPPAY